MIRNHRLMMETWGTMGNKLSTLGIDVMKPKSKNKSTMLARVRKIAIPFQWL